MEIRLPVTLCLYGSAASVWNGSRSFGVHRATLCPAASARCHAICRHCSPFAFLLFSIRDCLQMLRRSLVRSFAGKAAAASGTTSKPIATSSGGYRLKFDPKSIMPHEFGHVRIINNTTRDAQQSNCSAEMAHEHRIVRPGHIPVLLP
jgi:hypothetical protein